MEVEFIENFEIPVSINFSETETLGDFMPFIHRIRAPGISVIGLGTLAY